MTPRKIARRPRRKPFARQAPPPDRDPAALDYRAWRDELLK